MEKKKTKKWIKAATENSHGQFRKKAESAGMSTHAYAEKEKHAGGLVGKQANLALNLTKASRGKKHKAPTASKMRNNMYGTKGE